MEINTSNLSNLSCEERRLVGFSSLDEDTETALQYVLIGFLALVFPFTVALNSLTIFLVIKFKHLHQTTFFLALQVVAIDLAHILITIPTAIISALAGEWILGLPLCYIVGGINTFLLHIRLWIMFVLVFDRFCTVFMPFSYPRKRTRVVYPLYTVALSLAVASIVVSLANDCIGFDRIASHCVSLNGCANPDFCFSFNRNLLLAVTIVGSVVPLIMYIVLFIKGRRARNRGNQIEPRETVEQKNRERRVNITFLFLFLSVFGVVIVPHLFISITGPVLRAIYTGPLPEGYLVLVFLVRAAYDLLPIVDSIAVMRNPDMRKAWKMLIKKARART